ncbi:MAG: phosphatase PAP2 family protein [Alphaproteobacteria bacterium]
MPMRVALDNACRLMAVGVLAFGLGACAGRPGAPGWGADTTIAPGWGRVGDAALTAATDPFTWVPVLGAAALQIGDFDNEIADWANDETPLFGSRGSAADASDWLRVATLAAYLGTGLAAPVGEGENPIGVKVRGFIVGGAAIVVTERVTRLGKKATKRERPLGQSDTSFPSRHASIAAVAARLSRETLRHYDLSPGTRFAADTGLAGLALMTGWARVEAGKHHPADVLAGAALGNFFAVFATEAFLRPALADGMALNVGPYRDGWALRAEFAF